MFAYLSVICSACSGRVQRRAFASMLPVPITRSCQRQRSGYMVSGDCIPIKRLRCSVFLNYYCTQPRVNYVFCSWAFAAHNVLLSFCKRSGVSMRGSPHAFTCLLCKECKTVPYPFNALSTLLEFFSTACCGLWCCFLHRCFLLALFAFPSPTLVLLSA